METKTFIRYLVQRTFFIPGISDEVVEEVFDSPAEMLIYIHQHLYKEKNTKEINIKVVEWVP